MSSFDLFMNMRCTRDENTGTGCTCTEGVNVFRQFWNMSDQNQQKTQSEFFWEGGGGRGFEGGMRVDRNMHYRDGL